MSNRYEITSLLEKDYLGSVFLALDVTLQRKVVYRKFNAEGLKTLPAGFKQYTGKLCALQHPNLLTIYDIDCNDEGYYMVTQFLEADVLIDRLKLGVLDQTGVYNMAADLLDALHTVHSIDLYHGALSMDSISRLERPRGGHRYLIVDLGLVEMGNMVGVKGNSGINRTMLLAPELLDGDGRPDFHSDLFALGHLCYQALVGDHPMAGKSPAECAQAYRNGGMPHLKEQPVVVQEDFADWIMTLISSDPAKRPSTSEEAMVSLHGIKLNVPAPNVPGVTQAVVEVAPHVPPHTSEPIIVADEDKPPMDSTIVVGAPKNKQMMIIGGLVILILLVLIGVMVSRGGGGDADSANAADLAISGEGPVFLQPVKVVHTIKDGSEPSSVDLDTANSLDWTIIKGVPTASKRISKDVGGYITSISTCGDYKEFVMPHPFISYTGNGNSIAPKGGMTNVDQGSAEFGEGWEIMLRIPKKHQGAMMLNLYMLQDHCDFDIEVKIHDTDEMLKLKVPYSSVRSAPGVVQIPIYIKEPTPGGFYTIKILAASKGMSKKFGMALSAVHVEKQ